MINQESICNKLERFIMSNNPRFSEDGSGDKGLHEVVCLGLCSQAQK